MKNVKMMIFMIRYYAESVFRASMSPFSDKNPLSFKDVGKSSIKNALTLSKRPILGYTLGD